MSQTLRGTYRLHLPGCTRSAGGKEEGYCAHSLEELRFGHEHGEQSCLPLSRGSHVSWLNQGLCLTSSFPTTGNTVTFFENPTTL